MRANLDLGGGLIMAEAVMLDLGKAIGRQHAHDVVYDAAQAAFVEGKPFAELLAADPRVTAHLDAQADRGTARPDRLYRAVRRHGARSRIPRPRHRRRDCPHRLAQRCGDIRNTRRIRSLATPRDGVPFLALASRQRNTPRISPCHSGARTKSATPLRSAPE